MVGLLRGLAPAKGRVVICADSILAEEGGGTNVDS